jgi:hypothetical protein
LSKPKRGFVGNLQKKGAAGRVGTI